MIRRFAHDVVAITGAASGIGAETARQFAREGACVAVIDRSMDQLQAVARALPTERCLPLVADVSEYDQIASAVQAVIDRFGSLSVMVNNAGVVTAGTVLDSTVADWDRVMNVNAGGVFNGSRAALPALIESRGCIVNTASLSGLGADWGMAVYDASKGAVVNLTRALALDHGAQGVRVNAVCPTVTNTAMSAGLEDNEEVMARLRQRIPLGRIAQPDDIAKAILFLASSDAAFITGVCLPVDGGVSASNGQPSMQ
jgi:meso-butanediol dehydrogenase / (S,S)-butanediol dehydrogenase / diacetyl reductase